MNKQIDFSKLGGYPLDEDGLEFMQDSYRAAFGALTGLIGDMVIVQGVNVIGMNATPGWISINGELMPFMGGNIGSGKFLIDVIKSSLTYEDGISKEVVFEKVAKFSALGNYNFSDLKRPETLRGTWLKYDVKQLDCPPQYVIDNFDLSTGMGYNERSGWAICDGRNGTKNRGGRVAVGLIITDVSPGDGVWDEAFRIIGNAGSQNNRVLTVANLPEHDHYTLSESASNGDPNAPAPTASNGPFPHIHRSLENAGSLSYRLKGTPNNATIGATSKTGNGQEFSIRDPFVVTLFIQKI